MKGSGVSLESGRRSTQVKSDPPSTLMFAPVMYELRREATNAITGPISAGSPARFHGAPAWILLPSRSSLARGAGSISLGRPLLSTNEGSEP